MADFFAEKDPERIPQLLQALEQVWRAQPNTTLSALWGQLENQGVGWATTDEQLLNLLRQTAARYPELLPRDTTGRAQGCATIQCDQATVTVSPEHVIVDMPGIRPSVWHYDSIDQAGVARPLRIRRGAAQPKVGLVHSIQVWDGTHTTLLLDTLPVLHRSTIGDRVLVVDCLDTTQQWDCRLRIGRHVDMWVQHNRELHYQRVRYTKIHAADPGQKVVIERPSGGEVLRLSQLQQVYMLSSPLQF